MLHFSKKNDLGIIKNYRDTTLTTKVTKANNFTFHNRIRPEVEDIVQKKSVQFSEKIDQ